MQERQARVGDAASELALGSTAGLKRLDQAERERIAVVGAAVSELLLGESPDLLVRIEFRRVGREVLEAQSRHEPAQGVSRRAAMKPQAVPEHDHRAAQMAQQVGEEAAGTRMGCQFSE